MVRNLPLNTKRGPPTTKGRSGNANAGKGGNKTTSGKPPGNSLIKGKTIAKPHVPCKRSILCNKPAKHPGACNRELARAPISTEKGDEDSSSDDERTETDKSDVSEISDGAGRGEGAHGHISVVNCIYPDGKVVTLRSDDPVDEDEEEEDEDEEEEDESEDAGAAQREIPRHNQQQNGTPSGDRAWLTDPIENAPTPLHLKMGNMNESVTIGRDLFLLKRCIKRNAAKIFGEMSPGVFDSAYRAAMDAIPVRKLDRRGTKDFSMRVFDELAKTCEVFIIDEEEEEEQQQDI